MLVLPLHGSSVQLLPFPVCPKRSTTGYPGAQEGAGVAMSPRPPPLVCQGPGLYFERSAIFTSSSPSQLSSFPDSRAPATAAATSHLPLPPAPAPARPPEQHTPTYPGKPPARPANLQTHIGGSSAHGQAGPDLSPQDQTPSSRGPRRNAKGSRETCGIPSPRYLGEEQAIRNLTQEH